ncbi:MAG: transposase [Bacteroidaceae bacterium]|nr:transposase [Bacteroidaceae bacterium]
MARKARESSPTGIYHVMLRGVNRQDIFECEKDYLKFLYLMQRVAFPVDEKGRPMPPNLIIYAYCLMPNHVHLLVKEHNVKISDAIKSISVSYAFYFNVKYEHLGHLFQDRFRSEVVNDMDYFVTLIRYIHQNPVAGAMVNHVRDYPWSSWCEYDPKRKCYVPVCTTQTVLDRFSFGALEEIVNEQLPETHHILDFDNDTSVRMRDDKVRNYIRSACKVTLISEVQQMPQEQRNEILKQALEYGASIRQISRVTGVSRGIIQKLVK